MAFRPEVLFRAAKRMGMLVEAQYLPSSAIPVPFSVSLTQPDELLLGDQVMSTDVVIEYETAALPARVEKGDEIQLGATIYRARMGARKRGDGYYSVVALEEV